MSTYTPDHWAIIRVTAADGEVLFKVLADWSGSYLEGSSWRINSGITAIVEEEDRYVIEGYSGSTYHCRKGGEGLGVLSSGIFAQYEKALGKDIIRMSSLEEAKDALNQADAVKVAGSKIASQ